MKHPIILPNNHYVTKLIIDHIHKYTLHGGTQLVLSTLRNKYWLLNARNTIRHQLRQCIQCFRAHPTTSTQIMGDLPPARVNASLPFEHSGVDYAGPITIKTSKLRTSKSVKGYLSLFVCMATKAVHIEVVTDLSTDSFIAALKRFISRRGRCCHLYSDCGTNFVGANKLLNAELKQVLQNMPEEISKEISTQGIHWHFNPPSAPHFGGLWEASVKLAKTHLQRTLHNAILTYEELSTVCCQIEACINSRPLIPLTNDANEFNFLTPGHFLTGRNIVAIPEPTLPENCTILKRWQYIQHLYQQFWKKWSTDYLLQLQERAKWRTNETNIKVNDLVLIKDERYPPTKWPIGRIKELHPGKDDHIRVVTIETADNTLVRPINKVCVYPSLTHVDKGLTSEQL